MASAGAIRNVVCSKQIFIADIRRVVLALVLLSRVPEFMNARRFNCLLKLEVLFIVDKWNVQYKRIKTLSLRHE